MSFFPKTRSRVYREDWTGRRRHYKCRVCGEDFIHDGHSLPNISRICPICLLQPAHRETYNKGFIERDKTRKEADRISVSPLLEGGEV